MAEFSITNEPANRSSAPNETRPNPVVSTRSNSAREKVVSRKAQIAKQQPYKQHCSDGALRIATRICSTFPEHHRVIVLTGMDNKNPTGLTAFQTAIALSMMDEGRVLLVDAYAKKPFLGDLLRFDKKPKSSGKAGPAGLVQVLEGDVEIDDVLLTGSVPNLDFLTAGAAIDPSLFLTERCGAALKHMREKYAYVVIAAAPVMQSPESMRLAVHCDGVAAIVTPGKHSQKDLRQLASDLADLAIPLLGVIFSGR